MGNIFNDIPVNLEPGGILRITLNCKGPTLLRNREEATFAIDFYYIVSKFDYKLVPAFSQSVEQEPAQLKRRSGGVVLNLEHDGVLVWCDLPPEQLLTSLKERFRNTSSKIVGFPVPLEIKKSWAGTPRTS